MKVFAKLLEAFPEAGVTPSKTGGIVPWMYLHTNFKSRISSEYYEAQNLAGIKYVDDDYLLRVALFVINASIGAIKSRIDTEDGEYTAALAKIPE